MKKGIIFLIILVLTFFIMSCNNGAGGGKLFHEINFNEGSYALLPLEATIIKDHGNGWIEFELDDKLFLFKHVKSAYRGYTAITQIR